VILTSLVSAAQYGIERRLRAGERA
jgi:hypothetical protein